MAPGLGFSGSGSVRSEIVNGSDRLLRILPTEPRSSEVSTALCLQKLSDRTAGAVYVSFDDLNLHNACKTSRNLTTAVTDRSSRTDGRRTEH